MNIKEILTMKNGTVLTSSKNIVKKLLVYFCLAFIFVFTMLAANQFFLLFNFFTNNKTKFFQGAVLFLYTLPAVLVMAIPFSVCIGFIYGLIKIDLFDNPIKYVVQN
jgi:lipopolysaccharide export LptBFGC system permease protein LptF